jgi:hypothetical protein
MENIWTYLLAIIASHRHHAAVGLGTIPMAGDLFGKHL